MQQLIKIVFIELSELNVFIELDKINVHIELWERKMFNEQSV